MGQGALPKRTCPRHIEQPRVDAFGVELVVARQHAQILSLDKIIGADGAGEVVLLRGRCGCLLLLLRLWRRRRRRIVVGIRRSFFRWLLR